MLSKLIGVGQIVLLLLLLAGVGVAVVNTTTVIMTCGPFVLLFMAICYVIRFVMFIRSPYE